MNMYFFILSESPPLTYFISQKSRTYIQTRLNTMLL